MKNIIYLFIWSFFLRLLKGLPWLLLGFIFSASYGRATTYIDIENQCKETGIFKTISNFYTCEPYKKAGEQ